MSVLPYDLLHHSAAILLLTVAGYIDAVLLINGNGIGQDLPFRQGAAIDDSRQSSIHDHDPSIVAYH